MRELGAAGTSTWAGIEALTNGRTRLVAMHRISRAEISDDDLGRWLSETDRLATLAHPNVVRVREVLRRADDVLVVGDFVDGVRWTELVELGRDVVPSRDTLSVRLRGCPSRGLSAVHDVRMALSTNRWGSCMGS